jgi:hypothetical protein
MVKMHISSALKYLKTAETFETVIFFSFRDSGTMQKYITNFDN